MSVVFRDRYAQIAFLEATTENSKAAVDVIDLIDDCPELRDRPGVADKINRLCDAVRLLTDLAREDDATVHRTFGDITKRAIDMSMKQMAELQSAARPDLGQNKPR